MLVVWRGKNFASALNSMETYWARPHPTTAAFNGQKLNLILSWPEPHVLMTSDISDMSSCMEAEVYTRPYPDSTLHIVEDGAGLRTFSVYFFGS